MSKYLILRDGRKIELLSDEEDRRVTEAALADPDAQPWTEEELAKVVPVRGWRYPRELLTAEQRELYDRTNDTRVIRDNPKAESK